MNNENSRWYALTLLFASRIGDSPSLRPLCEERVVLFRAKNELAARKAAASHAEAEGHSYKNSEKRDVKWYFVGVVKLEVLDEPARDEGWEVGSRFIRRSLRTIRQFRGK